MTISEIPVSTEAVINPDQISHADMINEVTDAALETAAGPGRGGPTATQSTTFRTPCCGTCV